MNYSNTKLCYTVNALANGNSRAVSMQNDIKTARFRDIRFFSIASNVLVEDKV